MVPRITAMLTRLKPDGAAQPNRTLLGLCAKRLAIPHGATACPRPSPLSSSSCDRFCTAIPRAAICRICRAYDSVRRTPAVKGVPRSRWLTPLGQHDQLVAWLKPKTCPSWLAKETLSALPP